MAWQMSIFDCGLNSLETSECTAKSTTGHTNSTCTERESICPKKKTFLSWNATDSVDVSCDMSLEAGMSVNIAWS